MLEFDIVDRNFLEINKELNRIVWRELGFSSWYFIVEVEFNLIFMMWGGMVVVKSFKLGRELVS